MLSCEMCVGGVFVGLCEVHKFAQTCAGYEEETGPV